MFIFVFVVTALVDLAATVKSAEGCRAGSEERHPAASLQRQAEAKVPGIPLSQRGKVVLPFHILASRIWNDSSTTAERLVILGEAGKLWWASPADGSGGSRSWTQPVPSARVTQAPRTLTTDRTFHE